MSLVKNLKELKKGKWYYSPNLWFVDRPNTVEMNKDNAGFIQQQNDKKILHTTPEEAMEQAQKILEQIGGKFEKLKTIQVDQDCKVDKNLNLVGEQA